MIIKIILLAFIGSASLLCIVWFGSLIYSRLSELFYERKLRNNYMFVSKNFYERHMQEKAELKKRLDEYDELFDRIYRIKGNDFNFGIKIITDKPVDSDEHKFIYKYPASSFGPCYDTSVFVQIM